MAQHDFVHGGSLEGQAALFALTTNHKHCGIYAGCGKPMHLCFCDCLGCQGRGEPGTWEPSDLWPEDVA